MNQYRPKPIIHCPLLRCMARESVHLAILISALFLMGSLPLMGSVSAEEIDNWPENDAWLHIELISWTANQTVEWDNNDGLPDPQFRICIEADGDNVDCINSPTWENQWSLNNSWNYSLDIPDHSNILNISIECEDNDALNDDECDMNSELGEWKLYAEYNWSATPTLTVSGNGDGDGNDTWKNAASTWKFTIDGFGDEDGDGVSDNLDQCPSSEQGLELLTQTEYIGCNWNQLDLDGDRVVSIFEQDLFDARIRTLQGGGRIFDSGTDTYSSCRIGGSNTIPFGEMFHVTENGILTTWINETRNYDNADYCPTDSGMDTWGSPFRADQILSFDFTKNESFKITDFKVDHALESTQHYTQSCHSVSDNGVMEQTIKHIGDGKYISHCYTEMDPTNQAECPTQSSIFLFNESEINHIMDINMTWPSSEGCPRGPEGRTNTLKSHIGAFGDFNADGVIDFVQGKIGECEIYYGLASTNFSFFGPQTISQSGCNTNLIAIDLDLDGYDDISSFSQTIFSEDGSFEVIPHSGTDVAGMRFSRGYADVYHLNHYDIDFDGDQDLLRIGCTYTASISHRNWCEVNLIENLWMLDDDSDNIANSEDYCPDTELDSIVDENGCSSSQKDTDKDGIMDDLDLCPSTLSSWTIDSDGCAAEQLDDDNDGINNSLDECPNTPDGDLINIRGCSTKESTDADGDGVANSEDDCPDTPPGYPVLENGCSDEESLEEDLDGDGYSGPYSKILFVQSGDAFPLDPTQWFDEDNDGYGDNPSPANNYDACPNTKSGASVNAFGCSDEQLDSDYDGVSNAEDAFPYDQYEQYDADNDGIGDNSDQCSDSIVSNVDSTGCSQSQLDSASAGSDGDAMLGFMTCCVLPIGMVVYFSRPKKKKATKPIQYVPMNIPASRPVQRQPTQQEMHAQNMLLEKQRETNHLQQQLANQASQTQHLQQQLAQQNQTAAQMNSMQAELAALQQSKATLEKELEEAAKGTTVVQNITYNIQDSAIAGDLNANLNPKSDEN